MGLLSQIRQPSSDQAELLKLLSQSQAQQNVLNPAQPEPSDQGMSIGGFLKNIPGDVQQFVGGISGLAKIAMSDLYRGADKLTGGLLPSDAQDEPLMLDDLAKDFIPSTLKYVKDAYLSGPKALGEHLYNDPLFALTDVLGVGEGLGALKVRGAKSALPGVAAELKPLGILEDRLASARMAGTDFAPIEAALGELRGNISPNAQKVLKTLPGAARNLVDDLYPLGGTKHRFVGSGGQQGREGSPFAAEKGPVGLIETAGRVTLPMNPFKRTLHEGLDKLMTFDISEYNKFGGESMAEALRSLDPQNVRSDQAAQYLQNQGDMYVNTLSTAQKYGITRMDRPAVAKLRLHRYVDGLFGDFGSSFYRHRDQAKEEFTNLVVDNSAVRAVLDAPGGKAKQDALWGSLVDRLQVKTGGQFEVKTLADLRQNYLGEGWRMDLDPQTVIDIERQLGFGSVTDDGILTVPTWADVDNVGTMLEGKGLQNVTQEGNKVAFTLPDGRPVQALAMPEDGARMSKAIREVLDETDLVKLEQQATQSLQVAAERRATIGSGSWKEAYPVVNPLRRQSGLDPFSGAVEMTPEVVEQSAKDVLAYIGQERRAREIYATDLSEALTVRQMRDKNVMTLDRELDALGVEARWLVHKWMTGPSRERAFLRDYSTVVNHQMMPYKLQKWQEAQAPEVKAALAQLFEEAKAAMAAGDPSAGARAGAVGVAERFANKTVWDLADARTAIDDMDMTFDLYDEMKAAGRQTPVYFPHLDPHRVKLSDWNAKRATIGMKTLNATGAHKKSSGFLFLEDRYIKDPIEAYARRSSQVIRATEAHDFIEQTTRTMARPILDWSEFDGALESVWAPRAGKRIFKLQTDILDGTEQRLLDLWGSEGEGMTAFNVDKLVDPKAVEESMAAALKASYTEPEAMELFKRSITETFKDRLDLSDPGIMEILNHPSSDLQLYAIPKVAGDRLNSYAQLRFGKNMRLFWDAPTNFWRASVLTFSPRWLVNNFLGNIVFGAMQGMRMRDVVSHAFDPEFRKFVQKATQGLSERNRATISGGLFSEHFETAYGSAEGTAVAEFYHRTKQRPIIKQGRTLGERFRHWNNQIEEHFRAASYVKGLEKQVLERSTKQTMRSFGRSFEDLQKLAKVGMEPELANRALDSVNYFFNDYSRLGPNERGLVRRFIFPFYGFYKHVVRLATTFPGVEAGRAALLNRWTGSTDELDTELGMAPRWLGSSTPVGMLEGNPLFMNSRGANPFDILDDPMASVVGSFNPMIRGTLNYVTGRQLDRPGAPQFDAPGLDQGGNFFQPFGSETQFHYNETTGQFEEVTQRPEFSEMLIQNLPQLEVARDAFDAMQGNLGTRFSGTGDVRLDPTTGEPTTGKPFLLELMKLAGVSLTPYDLEQFQKYRAQDIAQGFRELTGGGAPAAPATQEWSIFQ